MFVERKEFKSLQINLEKGIFLLNGEDMKGIYRLDLEFDNGKWGLLISREESYEQIEPEKVTDEKLEKMTRKEILRQQLKLLAENAKDCRDEALPQISREMLNIVTYLDSSSSE